MFKEKKIIAVIPARSGSKGLKDKNIKKLNGKPLIAYTIDAAKNANIFDKIIVSTDSEKYAEISREYGAQVPFLRSGKNSSDGANSWDVVKEVLMKLDEKYDIIVLLQPTSPLRTSENILESLKLFFKKYVLYLLIPIMAFALFVIFGDMVSILLLLSLPFLWLYIVGIKKFFMFYIAKL